MRVAKTNAGNSGLINSWLLNFCDFKHMYPALRTTATSCSNAIKLIIIINDFMVISLGVPLECESIHQSHEVKYIIINLVINNGYTAAAGTAVVCVLTDQLRPTRSKIV